MQTPDIQPLICHQLHMLEDGCAQEIAKSAAWGYCPSCGRSTGHILALKTEGQLKAPKQKVSTTAFSLRNVGLSAVSVDLDMEMAMPGVKLAVRQQRLITIAPITPQGPGVSRVEIEIPALERSARSLGTLLIKSLDAPLESDDEFWQPRKPRVERLTLSVEVDTPAQVTPIEEVALFRYDVAERAITVINEGSSMAEIIDIEAPEGYEVVGSTGSRKLGSKELMTFKVKRLWHIEAAPESIMRIRSTSDTKSVTLHTATTETIRSRPFAIIGIDFGTMFSSIAFRECRYHNTISDEVEFLIPSDEEASRFPTVVWVGNMGDVEFSALAERRYQADPTQGVLLREIKTLLRDPHKAAIYPKYRASEGRQLLVRNFGDDWGEVLVMEYLRWLYQHMIAPELHARFDDPDVEVQYVFSLPVLDKAMGLQPQYNLQLEAMKRCIKGAGFPIHDDPLENRVEFALEPVCAALGLLHPPNDVDTDTVGRPGSNSWPTLGTARYPVQGGVTLAVFDSGGGTTDVVVGHVEEEQEPKGIRLTLTIESALGVGSDAETFGGEWVTKAMTSLLDDPKKAALEFEGENLGVNPLRSADGTLISDWYQGDTSFVEMRVATASSEDATSADIDRDKVERAKISLAADQEVETRGEGGSTTRIKPLLLPRLIQPRLLSLSDELEARVFDAKQRAATNYYLFVGGNTRIPFVRRWAQQMMSDRNIDMGNRRLLLPDRYLQLAVAYGAAWVPDARVRNAVSYDVAVQVAEQNLLTLPRNQSQDNVKRSKLYPLPPGRTIDILVQANVGDNNPDATTQETKPNPRVGRAQVNRTDLDANPMYKKYLNQLIHVKVVASLKSGVLTVAYAPIDPNDPKLEVELTPLLEYRL